MGQAATSTDGHSGQSALIWSDHCEDEQVFRSSLQGSLRIKGTYMDLLSFLWIRGFGLWVMSTPSQNRCCTLTLCWVPFRADHLVRVSCAARAPQDSSEYTISI